MTFVGVYRYASAGELDAAIAQVRDLLEGEDDDAFAGDLRLRRRRAPGEHALDVRVDAVCPRDWYLAYETLVEVLARRAIAGEVVGELDDIVTTYPGGEGMTASAAS